MKIAGCILAGGRSARFGADKGLALLHGRPLLEHAIGRLRPQVDAIVINTNSRAPQYWFAGLPIVADLSQGFEGPLAGVLSGLNWARTNTMEALVTVAVDTPLFPLDLVERLSEGNSTAVRVAVSGTGLHPTFAFWPVSVTPALASWLEAGKNRKMTDFLATQNCVTVPFTAALGLDPFFNINTPDDLRRVSGESLDGFNP